MERSAALVVALCVAILFMVGQAYFAELIVGYFAVIGAVVLRVYWRRRMAERRADVRDLCRWHHSNLVQYRAEQAGRVVVLGRPRIEVTHFPKQKRRIVRAFAKLTPSPRRRVVQRRTREFLASSTAAGVDGHAALNHLANLAEQQLLAARGKR